ncbi:MAG: hypothetical protein KDD10_26530, partial [Phaeodactylibacter sp.]|nr:hypothetical protein [Phaeodactylibacter sp.]
LVSVNANARLYSTDLLEDNGNLVVGAFGDKFGSSTTNLSLFLFQTDLSGNLNWAMEYNIPGGHTERCSRIWNTADGYLMLGTYRVGNTEKVFLFKTNKQGALQWSNTYGGSGRAISWDMALVDDYIYILGGTDNYGTTGLDIFLARLGPDGQAEGNACDFISPLVVEQAPLNNPYEGSHPLTAFDPGFDMVPLKTSVQEASLEQENQCSSPCEDCDAAVNYTPSNPNYCDTLEFSIEANCDFSTYYWTFCEPDAAALPEIDPDYDVGTLPSHCDFVDETANGGGYHLFVSNYDPPSGQIRRLDFGNSLDNTPATTIVNLPGASSSTNEGIDIVQSNGLYYGFLAAWDKIYRIEFGADITNGNPAVTQVTGYESIGFSWAHSLDLHQIDGEWWGILTARSSGKLVILFWGSDVSGPVLNAWGYTGGNAGSQFTGAAYIEEGGNHYVLACDFVNGLIRFDFGNALSNTPTATNLGFFGSGNQWSVMAYRECEDGYLGFLFKETGDDHKVIRFSPGIASPPVVVNTINGLGRISGTSSFHRVGDDLVFFASRSYDGKIAKLYYEGCNGIDIPNSTAANPSVVFPEPGEYEVRVVLNEGLPNQQTICETITIGADCGMEICDNGIDDDGNGLTDCDDPALADSCCCLMPPLLDLGPDTTLCEGETVVLDAGPGFVAYLWQDSLTQTQSFTVTSSGLYSVIVVDSCGVMQADSVTVIFQSAPPFGLGSDTVICLGESVLFSVPGYDTYQWSPVDGLDCTDCPTVTATPSASVTYTLEAATALGCTAVDSIRVSVESAPPLDLGNDTTICLGESITISVPGYASYHWSPAAGLDCTDCPTVTATPSASVTYTLEAATDLGCTAADSITVAVESAPPFELGNDTTICLGESVVFSVPGYDSYHWSPAAGLDCTDCPMVTATPPASVTYTLEVAT